MTLEEMLALLPDNNTGAIDADDLRTVVTGLFGRADSHYDLTGRWQFANSPGGVPGGAQFCLSHATAADSVWVRFAKLDKTNVDFTAVLMQQQVGQHFLVQALQNANNWAESVVTGAPINGSTYVQIPGDAIAAGGSTSVAAWQECLATFKLNTAGLGAIRE